jgi:hypothetical protein
LITIRNVAFPLWLAASGVVLATSALVVRSSHFEDDPELLSWAVSFDIAILLPVLYFVFARRARWPLRLVIPVFLLSLVIARLLLPSGHDGLLGALEFVVLPLEILVIGFLIYKARKVVRAYRAQNAGSGDFVEAFETVLSTMIGHRRVAQIAVTEASVIYYGLFGWRKASAPVPDRTFSYHAKNGFGGLVGVFLFLILIEAGLLHIVLLPRVAVLAWVLLVLSVYGATFLLADFNAARLRPIVVDDHRVNVRVGLRWRTSIAVNDISRVGVASADIGGNNGTLKAVLIGDANVVVELRQPHMAKGLYGITKRFQRIALAVDDVDGFTRAISSRLEGSS